MFTPLALNKNVSIKVDRFNSELWPTDTTDKKLGLAIPPSTYWTPGPGTEDGTIVVQAYPNSDYIPAPGGFGEFKWYLWASENGNQTSWNQFYIATQDNTQIGSYLDYPTLLNGNSNGLLRGSFTVNIREKNAGGAGQDALVILNSGSYYDWTGGTDLEPVRIAYTYDRTSDVFRASLNGETMTTHFENRSGKNVGTNKWLTDVAPVGTDQQTSMGYSNRINLRGADSGSFAEFAYYSSSLSQDELNVITNQPYGQPTNVLDKQPQVLYRIREEQKETEVRVASIANILPGNTAYPNLGTVTDTSVSQLKTILMYPSGSITSGSILNTQNEEYYSRT
jgi:hypothetical protein